jgi:hypothetical protein
MKAGLHYGKTLVELQIPYENVGEIIRPWQDKKKADNETVLSQALAGPQKDDFREKLADRPLCVLLSDGTRDMPFKDIFGQLFPALRDSSLVRFLLCTGTHNADTTANRAIKKQIEQAAIKAGIFRFEIHVHDYRRNGFIHAGRTSRGTEVTARKLSLMLRLMMPGFSWCSLT